MTVSYRRTDHHPTPTARRFFTLHEANRALVLVRKIVADITNGYNRMSDLQEALEAAQHSGRYDLADQIGRQTMEVVESLQACAQELADVGAELQDWVLGIVGFPCIAAGREVMLCWQDGDGEVEYWHEVNDGCGARKPICTLLAAEAIPAPQY